MRYTPPYKDLWIYYLKGSVGKEIIREECFIGNWQEEDDSFLFFTQSADTCIEDLLRCRPDLMLQDRFQMTYEQWQGEVLAPFRVGCLTVAPPWHEEAAGMGENGIVLDPGVVFGTGTHPTTHDCLSALQEACDYQTPSRVLDLGTGTGLLALAAIRLGAGRALAVDLNHLAVQTARHNAVLNRLTDRMLCVQGEAVNFIDISSDLVVSNIHYDILRQLVAAPGFLRHRQFVLSGLLRTQAREVELQLRRKPVQIVRKWERDGTWHTFYGRLL